MLMYPQKLVIEVITDHISRHLSKIFNSDIICKKYPKHNYTNEEESWPFIIECLTTYNHVYYRSTRKQLLDITDKVYNALKNTNVHAVQYISDQSIFIHCEFPTNYDEIKLILLLIKLQTN